MLHLRLCLLLLALASLGCRSVTDGRKPLSESPIAEDIPGQGEGLSNYSPRGIQRNVRYAMGYKPDEAKARTAYEKADELFEKAAATEGDDRLALFAEAAGEYHEAAVLWPDSMLEEDALFLKGESLFFADRYSDSRTAFDELVKIYPNTRHIDRVDSRRFDIAQYWLAVHRESPRFFLLPNFSRTMPRNDTYGNSVRMFDKIRLDDPTGKLADDACMAAGNAHFTNGDYREADRFFADLRRTYPDSDHYFEAALLSVKSKLQLHQGSQYDATDLEDATALITMMFEQFPQESDKHREYLENAYKDSRVKLAQRDWDQAQYYDRRGENRGARYYYDKVARDFPDTSLSAQALARLDVIRGEADRPPENFAWLEEAMPRPKNQGKPLLTSNPLESLRR